MKPEYHKVWSFTSKICDAIVYWPFDYTTSGSIGPFHLGKNLEGATANPVPLPPRLSPDSTMSSWVYLHLNFLGAGYPQTPLETKAVYFAPLA